MLNRVLVGIDFSQGSREALARAAAWAERLHLPLIALHVVEHPEHELFRLYAPMGDPAWFHEFEPKAQELLNEWIAPYSFAKGWIRFGNAAKQIIAEADARTLVVVGHVGHGALDSLFGSTAERVIRGALGDVLVVKQAGKS
ncbi:MAG TPA: universal stress protein [Holophagaceae bacterium]|nr:universal stress protein [Holophagaceae bacterium]